MNFRSIEAVITVAKYMSFSEAAYELNYSTSAISKQVASLEKSLNFKIFERSTKSTVSLTKNGMKIMPYIQSAYSSLDALAKNSRQLENDSHITISYVNARSGRYLKPLLMKYYTASPGAEITVKVLRDEEMWKKLRQGETDLVIRVLPGNVSDYEMPNEYYDTRGLMVIPIFEHTFKIAMREGHPLSSKECVTIEELINYQILHFKFGDSFMGRLNCEAFMKLFTDRGLNPNLKQIEDDNDLLILNMVESSDCVAPVLDTTATESKKIIVRPICGSPYRMSVCLLCLKDNLTPGVKRFIEFITGKKIKNAVK